MNWGETAAGLLAQVRRERPLIHHLTNLVVMNVTANATLAAGAAPVMAHAAEEVAEMTRAARAVVLNIGTLDERWVDSMLRAGRAANDAGVPVILDPVGAGATELRTRTAERLLRELRVAVLRGNAGEVGVLSGVGGRVQGVDSAGAAAGGAALARAAAQRLGVVAAVTGEVDHVSDGRRVAAVRNGHRLLTAVTGTGCMATAVVAAFVAVGSDPLVAAASALGYYGYAAEVAAARAAGPGSFQAGLFDALYAVTPEEVAAGVRIEWVEGGAA